MNKDKLIYFSQNYHMNAISDPNKNKIYGCVFLMGFPAVLLLGLKIYTVSMFCFSVAIILLIVSIFAKKIGNIEILNQIGLFSVLAVFYPILFMIVSIRHLGNPLPMFIMFIFCLICGIVSGVIYTNWKVNQNIKNKKVNWEIGVSIALGILLSTIVWFVSRIFSDNEMMVLLFVIGCACMIFILPKLILSFVQFYVLKKYKLELIDKKY